MVKHSAYRREAGGFDFVGLAGSRRLGGTLVLAGWFSGKKLRFCRESVTGERQFFHQNKKGLHHDHETREIIYSWPR